MSGPLETDRIRERYARRMPLDARYSLLNPAALLPMQERQRAIAKGLAARVDHVNSLDLLEVGCGGGGNLQEFLRLGFAPSRLTGIELLAERHAAARECLPDGVDLHLADAAAWLESTDRRFDVIYQSTVFSSLLDDAFQMRLAQAMWRALKPGGRVLWYDFTVDNPRNPDVRGVPLRRVRELFPRAAVDAQRLTLAPPIARAVVKLHPSLYGVFNALPLLRTHVLAWLLSR